MKKVILAILIFLPACGLPQFDTTEINVLDRLDPPYTVGCEGCDVGALQEAIAFWNDGVGREIFAFTSGDAFVRVREVPIIPGDPIAYAKLYESACDIQVEPAWKSNIPVLVHEFSHCLGFDHSNNPESVTYPESHQWTEITEEIVEIVEALIDTPRD